MVVNLLQNMFKKRINWFCSIVSDYLARTERLIPVENFNTENDCIWSLYYYLPTRPILIKLYMNSLNLFFSKFCHIGKFTSTKNKVMFLNPFGHKYVNVHFCLK